MATDPDTSQLREAIRADVAGRRWRAARAKLQELAAREDRTAHEQPLVRTVASPAARSTQPRPKVTVLVPPAVSTAAALAAQDSVARTLWWVPGLGAKQHSLHVPVAIAYGVLLLVLIFANIPLKLFVLLAVLAVYLAGNQWNLRRRLPGFRSSSYLVAGLAWLGLSGCAWLTLLLGLDAVPMSPVVAERPPVQTIGALAPAAPDRAAPAATAREAPSGTEAASPTDAAAAAPVVGSAPAARDDGGLVVTPSARPAEISPAAGVYAARVSVWARSLAGASDTLRTQSVQAVRVPALLDSPRWTVSTTAALAQLQAAGQDMQGYGPVPPEMTPVHQIATRIGREATAIADEYLQATSAAQARSPGGLQRLLVAANRLESLAGQCQDAADQAQALLSP